jgi:hypothetical protein
LTSEDEETKEESVKKQRETAALRQQLDNLLNQALLPKGTTHLLSPSLSC